MIKNYLKIAYRVLVRNKVFSLINIFGLSIALTSVIVIFLFVSHELSFDKYNSNYNHIYRVVNKLIQNGKENWDETVPVPLGEALNSDLSEGICVTQSYFNNEQLFRIGEEKYMQNSILYADTNFVKVFDVNFLIGKAEDLSKPNMIFLTRDVAEKYFGSIDKAINKEIIMMDSVSLNVAGVIENVPKNTHMPYQVILSWETLTERNFTFSYRGWGSRSSGFGTYLLLPSEVSPEKVENQIKEIVAKYNEQEYVERNLYFLIPLKSIHFDDRFGTYPGAYITSIKFIWLFSTIGLFILVIAFINFTNLSIVQIIKRAKEVGIRKVLGADRAKLIKQFLGETFIILLIAEVIALIFTEVVLDNINSILGNRIQLQLYGSVSVVLFLIIVLIFLTFISGIYPATVLSRYNPIKALRHSIKITKKKTFSLFNLLVILQFTISLVLIISAIMVTLQINYFKNKDLGFEKDYVYNIELPRNQVVRSNTFAEILKQNPDILEVSLGIGAPLTGSNITSSFLVEADMENDYYANVKTVDSTYYKLYKLNLVAGTWYTNYSINDSTFNIVVNKTLLNQIHVEKPADAIGLNLRIFGSVSGRIVGVVDDFHAYSLQHKIPSVIFMPFDQYFSLLNIRTNGKTFSQVRPFIEKSWNEIFPEYIFKYRILEDEIAKTYRSEERISNIIKIFTFIAIIIACLGLYGLVSFMLVQRTKEIGIRKAHGASVSSLIILVSKQFINLVLVSSIFAWPIAYYLMNKWLNNYAFKVDLNIWIFISASAALLIITFITIIYQSIKVSITNPVDVLKYE